MTAKLYSMAWIIVCWSEVRGRNGTWIHVINGRLFILIPWSFTHTTNAHGWSVHYLFVNMHCYLNKPHGPVNRYWLQSNAANFIRNVFFSTFRSKPIWFFLSVLLHNVWKTFKYWNTTSLKKQRIKSELLTERSQKRT